MKKISLQWRLTCIITLYIAVICGCLTLLVYKNGIYYIDSLQETVDARGDDAGDQAETVPQTVPIKSISAFRRTIGMNLPEISLFRCTTTKQTTKETA